jgi:hypothetical protein
VQLGAAELGVGRLLFLLFIQIAFSTMEDALLVFLGWALGILGGPIAEYVRRARRRKRFGMR